VQTAQSAERAAHCARAEENFARKRALRSALQLDHAPFPASIYPAITPSLCVAPNRFIGVDA